MMQDEVTEAFSNHLRAADAIMAAQLPDIAAADLQVMQAASIAVEARWTSEALWRTYRDLKVKVSQEKLIYCLAKLRLEASTGLYGREITDRMLFAFEDAERVDMLTAFETAFAPDYLPTH